MKNAYVLGSINLDYVYHIEKNPLPGETILAKDLVVNPGGKGANQAVAISNQEVNTYLIACLGDDADSDVLLDNLIRKDINTTYIFKAQNTPSAKAFVSICNGQNSIVVIQGANNSIRKEQVSNALSQAKKDDFFITQFETNLDVVFYGLQMAKEKQIITVLNPSPIQKIDKTIFQYVDYLILNDLEAKELSGIAIDSDEDFIKMNEYFKNLGVKQVIVTLGENGVKYVDKVLYHIDANPVQVKDTTACGDTFLGVFVASMMQENDLQDSVKRANIAASITATRIGAQNTIPIKDEIDALFIEND